MSEKERNKLIIAVYSLLHFVVDLSCAILVTNFVKEYMGESISYFWAVVLYDFFAFAMQLPIGIIADKVNKNALCSAFGCAIVAVAYVIKGFGIIPCIVAGIGNSLFHIGGGIDVLNISNKKAAPSGIFVATGAMGIFLGGKSQKLGFNNYVLMILMLLVGAQILYWLYKKIKNEVTNEPIVKLSLTAAQKISIVCLVTTVVIRSYVGSILAFDWKADIGFAILAVCAVVFGKMLGGIIGDRIGFKSISLISLVTSACLFLFAFESPIIGILAILLFNMTMPITLTALSNILNNNKGMAFGLLTLALFIGIVPIFLGYTKVMFNPFGLFAITMFSAFVLYEGVKCYEKSNIR